MFCRWEQWQKRRNTTCSLNKSLKMWLKTFRSKHFIVHCPYKTLLFHVHVLMIKCWINKHLTWLLFYFLIATLESELNAVNLLIWLLPLKYSLFIIHDIYVCFLDLYTNLSPSKQLKWYSVRTQFHGGKLPEEQDFSRKYIVIVELQLSYQ